MQAEMDKLVHIKLEGIMVEMLVNIDPDLYNRYSVMWQGQLVVYVDLNKALYETLCASLIFFQKLTSKLIERGYKINPYDWCAANKIIQGIQCSLLWRIDDIK